MRVLMTADAVGGVWNYALELARALAGHDVDVVLATMGPRPDHTQRAEAAELPNVRLVESDYRLEWMEDPWDDVERAGDWLLSLEAREHPDLVHVNGYAHGALPWSAPACVVAHSCVCSWWRAVRREPAPASWDRYRAAVRTGLQAAALVIAPTRAMLDALEAEHGRVANARCIHNARRAGRFPPLGKERTVLCVGRLWDAAKNAAAVGRVAARLPWPVYVAGDAAAPGRSGGGTGDARHLGHLSTAELARWLGHASVYALPARYEPFGLSALEAALAGCALILGDIASLRELWHGAALFVDPEDDDALYAALRTLVDDEGRRSHVAAACRGRALTFSSERMAGEYLRAYADAALAGHCAAHVPAPVPCGAARPEAAQGGTRETTCAS